MTMTMIERAIRCTACQGIGFDRTAQFYCFTCDGTGLEIVSMPVPTLRPVKVNAKRLALFFGAVCTATVLFYWWVLAPLLYKVFLQ